MSTNPVTGFAVLDGPLIDRVWREAECDRWDVSPADFATAVARSVEHRFRGTSPSRLEMSRYVDSLHLADLALACACAAGHDRAWAHFIEQYRPKLHAAAGSIAGAAAARDLADGLFADLYGLEEREGQRRSLFAFFHGRSSLATWLRAVLSQRHVDAVRASRRIDTLDAEQMAAAPDTRRSDFTDLDRLRYLEIMRAALAAALSALDARERLRLSYYYAHDLTLAHIGRLMNEHEATVSRKLTRTRQGIRREVERILRREHQLSEPQVELCFGYVLEEWPYDVIALLERTES